MIPMPPETPEARQAREEFLANAAAAGIDLSAVIAELGKEFGAVIVK